MLCRLKSVISVSCGEGSGRKEENNEVGVRHTDKHDESL